MKLCIPVGSPNGIESLIEPHLPRAEHLLFFDTESRACTEIALRDQSAGAAEDLQMHAVLCGSINRVTLRTLIEQGVKVYGTDAQTVAQAITQYENGELEAAVVGAGGCGGGGHGGGCGGGGSGGHGCGSGAGHHHDDQQAKTGEHACHGSGGGCGGHGHAEHSGGCCGSKSTVPVPAAEAPVGDVLQIAVCSQNRKTVTEHAGKCRKFWIYSVVQGEVTGKVLLELPLEQSLHASPAHHSHPLDQVNVLIGGGMGSGLQQRLLQRGVQGVVTAETEPDQAVALFLAGALDSLPPERAWIAPCSEESVTDPVCSPLAE